MSCDYLPKNIFRNKYSVFLQKSGLDALFAPFSQLLITWVATCGGKSSFTSLFRAVSALTSTWRADFLRLFPSLHFLLRTFVDEYLLTGEIIKCPSDRGSEPEEEVHTPKDASHINSWSTIILGLDKITWKMHFVINYFQYSQTWQRRGTGC